MTFLRLSGELDDVLTLIRPTHLPIFDDQLMLITLCPGASRLIHRPMNEWRTTARRFSFCRHTPEFTYQTAIYFSTLQLCRYRHRHPYRIRCPALCRGTPADLPDCNSVHWKIARSRRCSRCPAESP